MKKLLVGLITACFLMGSIAHAAITRTLAHQLTTGGNVVSGFTTPGTAINGTQIGAGNTLTSDSVYQAGSISYGYSALATTNDGYGHTQAAVSINYQTSYDNNNWFTPMSTTGNGLPTVVATLDSAEPSGNRWIVYNYTVYPYIRFVFKNTAATIDTITAETLWQDYV